MLHIVELSLQLHLRAWLDIVKRVIYAIVTETNINYGTEKVYTVVFNAQCKKLLGCTYIEEKKRTWRLQVNFFIKRFYDLHFIET